MENLDRLPLANHIASILTQRILTGAIAPGAPLRQDAFAHEFSTSHVPVREAFRVLELQNLVESVPRRGVRVTALDARGEREIAAMRSALEGLAIRSYAARPTRQQMDAITTAVDAGDNAEDILSWEASNRAFHIAVASPCAMPRLIAEIASLNLAYSRYVIAAEGDGAWVPKSNRHHRHILEAVEANHMEQAAILLSAHIRTTDRVRAASTPSG
jgi:DNA-binding GntR family transcriptional regulator